MSSLSHNNTDHHLVDIEVFIILKLEDGVTHPFRSIGGMFMSMIRPPKVIGNDEDTISSITSNLASNLIESSPVHDLKIQELPRIELPKLDFGLNLIGSGYVGLAELLLRPWNHADLRKKVGGNL
ncbi:hypothetical protein Tco_0540586 [Tanacetum coccineum]